MSDESRAWEEGRDTVNKGYRPWPLRRTYAGDCSPCRPSKTRSLIEIALECALGTFVGVTLALLFIDAALKTVGASP